jgi:DNA-binding NarL/FixJ family response regulator
MDGSLGNIVASIYEDSAGHLWAGAETGLWRWKPGPPRRYAMPDALPSIRALLEEKMLLPQVSFELAEHATDDALTKAEIDVLRLIVAGNANKQIADRLSITEETVKGRVRNILSKLGANDRTHAAMIGLKRG